jgi:hypothetical protein
MNNLTVQEINLLQKVKREPALRPYFFKKIKNIKWFSALENEGFFSVDEMPKIVQNESGTYRFPPWPTIEYLVKASEALTDNQNLIANFLFIVKTCSEKDFGNQYHNSYLLWNFAKIYRNIPFEQFSIDDISIVETWFSDTFNHDLVSDDVAKLLLTALENISTPEIKTNALKLLSILFQVKRVEHNTDRRSEISINLQSHSKDKLVIEIGQKIGSELGKEGIDILFHSLAEAVEIIAADNYSHIWRSAIEEHSQNSSYREKEHLLIVVCRETLVGYGEQASNEKLCELLKGLLEHPLSIVKRIAIHSYNHFFAKIGNNLIDNILSPEFFKSNFRHEMWHIFQKNFDRFSDAQKNKLLNSIEAQSIRDNGLPSYYYQAEWLLAISEHDDVARGKLDYALAQLNGTVPEHPDFTSYTSSRAYGVGESPIPLERLKEAMTRSIDELIAIVNNYRPSDSPFEPGIEELVRSFKLLIYDEAKTIHYELNKLEKLNVPFIYEVIQAYSEIWKDTKKPQPNWEEVWPSLLQFIYNILTEEKFWSEDDGNDDAFIGRKAWIVSRVCGFIGDGCKRDEHAFDIKHVGLAKNILQNVLENQKGDEFSCDSDAVSISINSNRGQCLEALINLALFECRFSNRQDQEHLAVWNKYSPLFTTELNEVKSLEFRTLLPMYLRNFKWLSNEWFEQSFNTIFTDELDLACICALQGYGYNNYLEPLMYEYLKKSDNFEKILDHDLLGEKIERRYINFGLIPYIFKDEPLDDQSSLIYRLIKRNKTDEFNELISLISHSFIQHENTKNKAQELFPIVLKIFNDETLESKKVLSNLVDWANFLDFSNNDHIAWLIQIAPYAELDHNAHDFMKVIEKISDVNPQKAIDVWKSLLTAVPSYPYPEKSYINIYKNLLRAGLIRETKNIVDTYITYGLHSPAEWFRLAEDSLQDV